jgi:hypothetical protein
MTEETIPLVTEEMTLDEYVGVLPSGHRAHAELAALKRDSARVVACPNERLGSIAETGRKAWKKWQDERLPGAWVAWTYEQADDILAALTILAALPGKVEPSEVGCQSAGVAAIAEERARQVAKEGWTPEHDDEHNEGEMAEAAACYASLASEQALGALECPPPAAWPWAHSWWKPKDQRRNLVRAGALIAAELDRLDRISPVPRPEPVRPPDIRHIHDPKG